MSYDYEKPSTVAREISVRGEKHSYTIRELSAAELEDLFDISDADGKVSREKSKGLRFRIIAAAVSREDGSAITAEQAGAMRNDVVKALHEAAMDVNGFSETASVEAGNG